MTRPFTFRAARPAVWMVTTGPEEALFIRIQHRDQRNLRQVQTLA
jgi:hypothetical protein